MSLGSYSFKAYQKYTFLQRVMVELQSNLNNHRMVANQDGYYRRGDFFQLIKVLREKYISVMINPRYEIVASANTEVTDDTLIKNPRILFAKNKFSKMTPLKAIFNGLVVDASNGAIISVPPRSPSFNPNKWVFNNKDKFHIYKATDGTLVTIYFWNDRWVVSSAHSVEFNDSNMFGASTVYEIMTDLLDKNGIPIDSLDKRSCYSFIFTHPEWHPRNDQPALKFVQKCNLDTFGVTTEADEFKAIHQEKIVDKPVEEIIHELQLLTPTSFSTGFILRNKDETSDSVYDYFLESSQMALLRKYIYSPAKVIRKFDKIALRAYLLDQNKSLLEWICPKFKPVFKVIDDRIEALLDRILLRMQYNKGKHRNTRLELATNFLVSKIGNNINPKNPNARSLVRDFIINLEYYDLYANLFFDN